MKGKFFSGVIMLLLLGSFGACTKCVKCTEYRSNKSIAKDYRETCGKKQVIKDYEAYLRSNTNPGNTIECTTR
jgi:hypothetical protein